MMETNFESLMEKMSASLKNMATTDTIMGETFTLGEFTCKPVMRIGLGYGSGAGSGENDKKNPILGDGAAAGAGIGMTPTGFLVAHGEHISFIPATMQTNYQTLFDKVPDLIDKLLDLQKERSQGKDKKGK